MRAVFFAMSNEPIAPQFAHVLVLELCEKGELFDLLYRGGPVPAVVCKEFFRQLMIGVKFLHGMYSVCVLRVCVSTAVKMSRRC